MRTVGALRDAQKENRKKHRTSIREQMAKGVSLSTATLQAGEEYDAEYRQLERQIEFAKTPGNTPRSRG